ncbi:transcriptional regulator domain-containing protein [Sphingopyxis sp.]|uniref:transcriptional regulator domain-containing protein n=1 Tax=Sphingopyxis sp. TaxID=1908224 RepID=UPI002FCAA64A
MSKSPPCVLVECERDWRSATPYKSLLYADRRGFAWEWLRRHAPYRHAWQSRDRLPEEFGLLAYEDPGHALADARPIWSPGIDPSVLASHPIRLPATAAEDMLDIRKLSQFVSVEIDDADIEHWLLTDGQWIVRLDLHDGTLLGGPVFLGHALSGFRAAEPGIAALRQLGALATAGQMPPALRPREPRAVRWVLELRTADAMISGASHQDMARAFYGKTATGERWRLENGSFRLRIQRLARTARKYLDDPFCGPWFSARGSHP